MRRTVYERVPHILKKRESTQLLTNLMFFDTETKDRLQGKNPFRQEHTLWFGYSIAWRYEHGKRTRDTITKFTTVDQFFNLVRDRLVDKKPLYIFAHNLAFDLTVVNFWKEIERRKISLDYFVAEDPPSIFRCTWNKKRMVLIDTLNFWRTSLLKLGKAIGIEKGEMPSYRMSQKKWDAYCLNDTRIISESVYRLLEFIEKEDLGGMGFTAPNFAMNVFRRRFMKHDIFIHDNRRALLLERESYYGGRVQCFFVGKAKKQKYYNLDVNSLYPFVMKNHYPVKLLGVINDPTLPLVRNFCRRYGVIASCFIRDNSNSFPKRYNQRLCFVTGKYSTTLCGPELERAFQNNAVQYVYSLAYYEQRPIFNSFVTYWWKMRSRYKDEENHVYSDFCKLLMNSLYGKFGQNGISWTKLNIDSFRQLLKQYEREELITHYEYSTLLHEVETVKKWSIQGLDHPIALRKLSNQIQIKLPLMEHWESFPAISAYVTSYAREYLMELINEAGNRHVYYCDTDSLFVDQIGFQNLRRANRISAGELGKLKVVSMSNNLIIYGPKDYVFGDKIVRKGIRHDAIQINDNTFQQNRFEGLKSIIKRGAEPFIAIERITKTNKREFNKGRIGNDGWVSNYNISEVFRSK